jgi:hypothetical protein
MRMKVTKDKRGGIMGSINHKVFNENQDILIFVKGHDHYCGYMVIQGKSPEDIGISETVLNVNGSEFIALNKALMNIKRNGLQADQRIKVYCSCENVACVANGERQAELLASQLEAFKNLAEGLPLQIRWVPTMSDGKRASELAVPEEVYAQDRLESLSRQMAEYKEGHHQH